MPPKRRQKELPVEGSWRMVDGGGENDSFETSIVPHFDDDVVDLDRDLPLSSDPSYRSSQPLSSFGASQESNHSIRDFTNRAEQDENAILRSPFRPSIASTRQASVDENRTPDPEFYMPSMQLDHPRRSARPSGASTGTRSSRTARAGDMEDDSSAALRRRAPPQRQGPFARQGTRQRRRGASGDVGNDYDDDDADSGNRDGRAIDRVLGALPDALVSVIAWAWDVLGIALRMLKYPIAICLAVYLFVGGLIVVQNMLTKSISASISPLCRIPGAGLLGLPFCPTLDAAMAPDADDPGEQLEFDGLMDVQSSFEQVLERSAAGVSLPMEMKRSETSIRDLRTLVRHSGLPQRDELLDEFNEYIKTAGMTAQDLQKFNVHVGSAVDKIISINRWTSGYIDSLAPPEQRAASVSGNGAAAADSVALVRWGAWLFSPFQPALNPQFDERALLDKYIEHTALVSDRIAALLLEAQGVLRLLTKAEDHLSQIYDVVTRSQQNVRSRRDDVLWDLWTLVGANNRRISDLNAQLRLLRSVDTQRSAAVAQVSALVVELEKIQAGLGDLRDRVAEPGLARETTGGGNIPLSVHIETIDRGVERLEEARRRIREAEDEKVREALARAGVPGVGGAGNVKERLLDGRGSDAAAAGT